MKSEPIVERIKDNDPKGLKWFFLLFFMLIPISGVLLFWFDGHARIEKEALKFTNEVVVSELKDGGDLIDIATPAMGDKIRRGDYNWMANDLGKLKSIDRLDADRTRAREEEDKGVIYAEIDFTGQFENGEARVHMLVKRQSMDSEWSIDNMELQVKK